MNNTRILEIESQIAELNKALEKEKQKVEVINKLPPAAQFAIVIHDNFCNSNHDDRCGWYYEIGEFETHNWERSTHAYWLEKAEVWLDKMARAGLIKDQNSIETAAAFVHTMPTGL